MEQALCEPSKAQQEQTRLGGDSRARGPGQERRVKLEAGQSQSAQGTEGGRKLETGSDLHTGLDRSLGSLLPTSKDSGKTLRASQWKYDKTWKDHSLQLNRTQPLKNKKEQGALWVLLWNLSKVYCEMEKRSAEKSVTASI